jgi:chromosome partitioning protein
VRLAEAPAHGLPILFYEKSSKGAIAYLNLAAELVKQGKKHKKTPEKSQGKTA